MTQLQIALEDPFRRPPLLLSQILNLLDPFRIQDGSQDLIV